ncbi:MAG: potassium transporter Kup [Arenicellales bacterium]
MSPAGSPDAGAGVSRKGKLPALCLIALGIVYGDIGTSPLYAFRLCFFGGEHIAATDANVLGALSLIFWALILSISIKYLSFVMRADNNGEGGVIALLALLHPPRVGKPHAAGALVLLGLLGASLLYGDGMITPAISVLSAVEGLEVAAPALKHLVIPLTVGILIALFLGQKYGTAWVGGVFGPIMLVWFLVLAALGVHGILADPHVLTAINPLYGVGFLAHNGATGYLVLGAVFLAVTGGEALYADMGHFGSRPIRVAWFTLVLPSLLLNYFGQGAYVLAHSRNAVHPFYNLVPGWGVYPMIGLATVATVIASQAIISGTFSLTRQAVQMGRSPPMQIVQTSAEMAGQIYVPGVNRVLMVATVALVLAFESSSSLASAYGLALNCTEVITTVLMFFVMRRHWRWHPATSALVAAALLTMDLGFFGANAVKILEGGWIPIAVALAGMLLMTTWTRGRHIQMERVRERTIPLETLLDSLEVDGPARVPGTGVFLTGPATDVPGGLLHQLKLNRVLHERVILLTAVTEDVPRVPAAERLEVTALRGGFYRVHAHYGFMQSPHVPVAVRLCAETGRIPGIDPDDVAYYADRAVLIITPDTSRMSLWRKRLYAFMTRNSLRAIDYYGLPVGRSIELGLQIDF